MTVSMSLFDLSPHKPGSLGPSVLSRLAKQGINEGPCSFLELLAAVSGTLHHGKSSREGDDDTSKSICIDRWQLVGIGAHCSADELLKSAEQALHALAHCCARDSRIECGARCQATPRRRTACHVRNDHVEEIVEFARSIAMGQRIPGRFQKLPSVLVEGTQENRFLVAVSVVETAALDARRRGKVLHRRVVETFPPEHIKCDRDHLFLVKLTRTHHSARSNRLFLTLSSRLTILSRMVSRRQSAVRHDDGPRVLVWSNRDGARQGRRLRRAHRVSVSEMA